jgi:zinc protease
MRGMGRRLLASPPRLPSRQGPLVAAAWLCAAWAAVAGGAPLRAAETAPSGTAAAPATAPRQVTAAKPAHKSQPPQPQPPKELRFPAFEQRTLANGLRVVLVEEHGEPAVSLRLLVPAGKLFVAPAKAGLSEAVASLLTKGTARRSAPEIAQAIDEVGGSLDSSSATDFATASARVTSDQLDLALDLLSDVALHPTFPDEEIDRWRNQALSDLQLREADGAYLADVVFQRVLYGGFPYGIPRLGTPESLRGLRRADLIAYHARQYVPNGSFLAVVGDIRPAEALAKVEHAFGAWSRGAEIAPPPFTAPPAGKQRIVVIDKPDAVQTQVRVGGLGISFSDPDLVGERVYNAVLGGGSTARLFVEVREKRGLTYGAYSSFSEELLPGPFRVATFTKTESTVEALGVTLDVMRDLGKKLVPPAELEQRKTNIIGAFPLEIQTPEGIAAQVVTALSHGKDRAFLDTYRDRVAAVTAPEVERFAAAHVHPDQAVIVLVGKAAAWSADLGKRFGPFETIAAADLDPLAPNLRRSAAEIAPAVSPHAASPSAASPSAASPSAASPSTAAPSAGAPSAGAPAATTSASPASPGALPPASPAERARARQLLRQAQQAMGGDAFVHQRSQMTRGAATMTPANAPQPVKIESVVSYRVMPGKMRLELKLPMGTVIQGFDGEVGWVSSGGKVQDQSAEMKERSSYGLDALRSAAAPGYDAQPLPDATQDGKPVQIVALTDPHAHTTRFALDPASHLVMAVAYELHGQTFETRYSDYQPVNGVQVARRTRLIQNGSPFSETQISEVQVNAPIDEALFKKPAG